MRERGVHLAPGDQDIAYTTGACYMPDWDYMSVAAVEADGH